MYSTISDLLNDISEKNLVQLVNDENAEQVDLSNIESEPVKRILKAIEDADAEINGYVRSLYTVPLSGDIDPRVNKLSRIIAKYNLFSRRNMDVSEGIENQYKMAVKDLEKIQQGTIKLDIQENSSSPYPEGSLFITDKSSTDRFFTDNLLKNALG